MPDAAASAASGSLLVLVVLDSVQRRGELAKRSSPNKDSNGEQS